MRARLALSQSEAKVELREIVLRDKPDAFLRASPSATVPCLVLQEKVIDESLDIMIWALERNDTTGWLQMPDRAWDLIAECDGPFKFALDRTKYASRYPDENPDEHRKVASLFLRDIEAQLDGQLYGKPSLADAAILPFVRQFAFIDKAWFDAQDWPKLHVWLSNFLTSERFAEIMPKFAKWQPGGAPVIFPNKGP